MLSASSSLPPFIVDSFVRDEVCPLCLDRYAAVDECLCVVCEAPSCPGCAELLDTTGRMRCYACAPAAVPSVPATLAPQESTLSEQRPSLRWFYRSLSALYSSGLRSLKKPIEALSLRMRSSSKSALITPSSDRPSSLSFSPR